MTTIVSIIYFPVMLAWSLLYFVFMFLLLALTAAFDRERVVLHKASKFWAMSFFALNPLWKLRVYGKENVDPEGRYVVTVNHQSMVDIPLMYVLPRINFKWVAKKEVYKWPLFGQILWVHGDIAVESGSVGKTKAFIAKGLDHLSRGTSVVIFPEGTRSKDGEIHNFKEGAFILAKEAGVEMLPCVINGVKDFVKGWRVQKRTFEVRILPPVPAQKVRDTDTRELMSEVRTMTVDALAEMRK